VAAIRLAGSAVVDPIFSTELTLLDPDGNEIALESEGLSDGSAFLRASEDLGPGDYVLEYRAPCATDAFVIPVTVTDGPLQVRSLGELTLEYSAYCPGETDNSDVGSMVRDFPPPVRVSVVPSEEASAHLAFIELQIQDDLGNEWTSGVLPSNPTVNPISMTRAAACAGSDTSVPVGHRTFSATAAIVDGEVLPTLTAEVDVLCLDCPEPQPPGPVDAGGPGSTSSGGATPDRGCSLRSSPVPAPGSGFLGALLFLACAALRLRATTLKRRPPHRAG
jgi:hypothetical protein